MIGDNLIYFCDSYYLMIDYDESLEEIVSQFIKAETPQLLKDTISEMSIILKNKKEKDLNYILEKSSVINTSEEDLLNMIKEIYDAFQKIINK